MDIGEVMGFYEALTWVRNLGLENVVIEGDSKLVINDIGSHTL